MELKETINGMTSADYKERFKAEYYQTKIRYNKLKNFCTEIEASEGYPDLKLECRKHDCPFEVLREQQRIMGEYLHILELRAKMEHIDLQEV